MTELHDLTALEQRDALRNGGVKATELVEHYLRRIDVHDQSLAAFVHVTSDLAREEADMADQALASGSDERPLLGLPFGFKDLHLVADVPITMGTTAMDPVVSPADAWTVGLLRSAGVSLVGTTHAPEFGAPGYSHSDVVGRPAVTPYDVGRYAGGSSGGAAAAVAAGLLPAAHGSDGAGSIRIPAAMCGLVGLKPTRGRVSGAPTSSFQSWTTEGPITRTVADAGLLLDVMANPPAAELHRLSRREGESFLAAAQRPPSHPLRIATWIDGGLAEPDADVIAAVDMTAALLAEHGHQVDQITNPTPWSKQSVHLFLSVFGGMAASLAQHAIAPNRRVQLQDVTRWLVELGESLTSADHVSATDGLAALAAQFLSGIEGYDMVLTPVTSTPAVSVGYFHEEGLDLLWPRMLDWAAFTPIQNMSGVPAISLPVHMTGAGLPVAAQLTAARHGDDALLLSAGAQLEQAIGWQHRHPPQWLA